MYGFIYNGFKLPFMKDKFKVHSFCDRFEKQKWITLIDPRVEQIRCLRSERHCSRPRLTHAAITLIVADPVPPHCHHTVPDSAPPVLP